ncbi:MAG: host attachment protein, partial [Novosphingobium sp.]|nr:host attachment protein [Novosphingobium sp.]
MKIPHNAWVLVGDGEKALFLRNEGDEIAANLVVERMLEQGNPPTREQGADRPGRFHDGASPHRSAVQDADWHRIEKDRFARAMADRLYAMVHKGRFDKLVIVAPPHTLGELRQHLHREVTDRVIAE